MKRFLRRKKNRRGKKKVHKGKGAVRRGWREEHLTDILVHQYYGRISAYHQFSYFWGTGFFICLDINCF